MWILRLKMSRKPLAYKNLVLYNDSQIPRVDFLGSQSLYPLEISKTTNHSPLAWPFELHVKQTPVSIACDWLIFLLSDVLSSCVWSCLLDKSFFRIKYLVHNYYLLIHKLNRKRTISVFEKR